jgi:hypothetical protein
MFWLHAHTPSVPRAQVPGVYCPLGQEGIGLGFVPHSVLVHAGGGLHSQSLQFLVASTAKPYLHARLHALPSQNPPPPPACRARPESRWAPPE